MSTLYISLGNLLVLSSKIIFLNFSIDVLRILFGTWWIFILIITSYYIAQLTAFMAKADNSLPINNLEEMIQTPYTKWMAVKGTALEAFINVIKIYTNQSNISFLFPYFTS